MDNWNFRLINKTINKCKLSILILISCTCNLYAQQIYFSENSTQGIHSFDIYISNVDQPCTVDSIIDITNIELIGFCHAVQRNTGHIYIKHQNNDSDTIYLSRLLDDGSLKLLFQAPFHDNLENISFISNHEILLPGTSQYFIYNVLTEDVTLLDSSDLFIVDLWRCGDQTFFIDIGGDIFEYFDGDFSNRNYLDNIYIYDLESNAAIKIDCLGRCQSEYTLLIRDKNSIEMLNFSDFTSNSYCTFEDVYPYNVFYDIEVLEYDLWLDLDETDEVCFSPDVAIDLPCGTLSYDLSAALPHIFATPYRIDSLSASLLDPSSTESISGQAIGPDMSIDQDTRHITWHNTGDATFEQFYQAIQSLNYTNTLPNTEPDTVAIAFYIYDGEHVSEVATAYLHIGYEPSDAGLDMMLNLCSDQAPTDLNDFVSEELAGGEWLPSNIVDPSAQLHETYQYIVQNDCSADTALYYISVSSNVALMSTDTLLCPGDSLWFKGNYYHEAVALSDTIKDAYACDSIIQELHLSFAPSAIYVEQDTFLCYGDSILLGSDYIYTDSEITINISNSQGCDSINTLYHVQFGQAASIHKTDTIICPGDSILIGGQYYYEPAQISTSISNSLGCDSIVTNHNIQHHTLQAASILVDGNFCTDSIVYLSISNTDADQIIWNDSIDTQILSISQAGIYTSNITDINGCTQHISIEVAEAEAPVIDGVFEYTFVGTDTTFTPQILIEQYESIVWTPAEGLSCTDCPAPIILADAEKTYQVTSISDMGCATTSILNIYQELQPSYHSAIANIFSPNAHNIENRFFYYQSNIVGQYDMSIYDRWGTQVFADQQLDSNVAEQGWNGNHQTQAAMSGVYVYHISYMIDGVEKSIAGTLTLVR